MASRKKSTPRVLPPAFGIEALKKLMETSARFEDNWKCAKRQIVHDFELSGLETELTGSMVHAVKAYENWQKNYARYTGKVGTKAGIKRLRSALKTSLRLLEQSSVETRLHLAAHAMDKVRPAAPADDVLHKLNKGVFVSPADARERLRGLLAVVEAACGRDERQLNSLPRDDLRAAAEPLYEFWVQVAQKNPKVDQWGDLAKPAVKFLTECLKVIDDDVTQRLVADFELPR